MSKIIIYRDKYDKKTGKVISLHRTCCDSIEHVERVFNYETENAFKKIDSEVHDLILDNGDNIAIYNVIDILH